MRFSNSVSIVETQLVEIQRRFDCDLPTAALINQSIELSNIADELVELREVLRLGNEPQQKFPRAA